MKSIQSTPDIQGEIPPVKIESPNGNVVFEMKNCTNDVKIKFIKKMMEDVEFD